MSFCVFFQDANKNKNTDNRPSDTSGQSQYEKNFMTFILVWSDFCILFFSNNLLIFSHLHLMNVVYLTRFTLDFDCIECLAKGGYGHVFKARDKLVKKYYAVKIVRHKE